MKIRKILLSGLLTLTILCFLLVVVFTSLSIIKEEQDNYTIELVECYDKNSNVIQGTTCEKKVYDSFYMNMGVLFAIITGLLLVIYFPLWLEEDE